MPHTEEESGLDSEGQNACTGRGRHDMIGKELEYVYSGRQPGM